MENLEKHARDIDNMIFMVIQSKRRTEWPCDHCGDMVTEADAFFTDEDTVECVDCYYRLGREDADYYDEDYCDWKFDSQREKNGGTL